jgi:hypothetical protein
MGACHGHNLGLLVAQVAHPVGLVSYDIVMMSLSVPIRRATAAAAVVVVVLVAVGAEVGGHADLFVHSKPERYQPGRKASAATCDTCWC